jgi:hypothetical protein
MVTAAGKMEIAKCDVQPRYDNSWVSVADELRDIFRRLGVGRRGWMPLPVPVGAAAGIDQARAMRRRSQLSLDPRRHAHRELAELALT